VGMSASKGVRPFAASADSPLVFLAPVQALGGRSGRV
jgi:hypothetical protein